MVKIKSVKCKVCDCHVEPCQEDVVDKRNGCDMKEGCGLGRWNVNILPHRQQYKAPVIPIFQKQLPVLLEKKPPVKTTSTVDYETDVVELEISDPLYVHIGKKNRVRDIEV